MLKCLSYKPIVLISFIQFKNLKHFPFLGIYRIYFEVPNARNEIKKGSIDFQKFVHIFKNLSFTREMQL